jgi:ATP-dependent Lon protease
MTEAKKTTAPVETATAPPKAPIPSVVTIIGSGSTVMYPQQLMPVLATEERDIGAIDQAATSDTKVLGIFAQKALEDGSYGGELHKAGTAATIVRMAKAPDGSVHAILQGMARIRLVALEQEDPWRRGKIRRVEDVVAPGPELDALTREVTATFRSVVSLSETLPKELSTAVGNLTDPSALADFVAANLPLKQEKRQEILEELDVNKRLTSVRDLLSHEAEVLDVQTKIQSDVRGELDKRQREFILREQLKAIQKELGEGDVTPELAELKNRLDEADLPEVARKEADREMQRLVTIPPMSPEYQVARTYLEWLSDLPWAKSTDDQLDLVRVEKILNEDHYGLEKVKQRILDFLAVLSLPVLRGASGHREDVARAVHRSRPGPEVHPRVVGWHKRRSRDKGPPPHVRGGDARKDHPGDSALRVQQSAADAGRGGQAGCGLSRRSSVSPVGGVGPGAEPDV